MIRFIYIGGQVVDDARWFMFYDSVIDEPIDLDSQVIWNSVEEFKWAAIAENYTFLERCLRLIPDWYIRGEQPPVDWHTGE